MYIAEGMHNFQFLWDGGGQRNTLMLDAPPSDLETAKMKANKHIKRMYWGDYRIVYIEERWEENGKIQRKVHLNS